MIQEKTNPPDTLWVLACVSYLLGVFSGNQLREGILDPNSLPRKNLSQLSVERSHVPGNAGSSPDLCVCQLHLLLLVACLFGEWFLSDLLQ